MSNYRLALFVASIIFLIAAINIRKKTTEIGMKFISLKNQAEEFSAINKQLRGLYNPSFTLPPSYQKLLTIENLLEVSSRSKIDKNPSADFKISTNNEKKIQYLFGISTIFFGSREEFNRVSDTIQFHKRAFFPMRYDGDTIKVTNQIRNIDGKLFLEILDGKVYYVTSTEKRKDPLYPFNLGINDSTIEVLDDKGIVAFGLYVRNLGDRTMLLHQGYITNTWNDSIILFGTLASQVIRRRDGLAAMQNAINKTGLIPIFFERSLNRTRTF